jgi:hypothetical protein
MKGLARIALRGAAVDRRCARAAFPGFGVCRGSSSRISGVRSETAGVGSWAFPLRLFLAAIFSVEVMKPKSYRLKLLRRGARRFP